MSITVWIQWEYEMAEEERAGWEELFQKAAEAVMSEEKVHYGAEVELNIVDDGTIHELNRQYREVDRATDVLSFPLYELQAGQAAEELKDAERDPDSGRICLGNIILSWDHVKAQAEEYGHSRKREAAFLIIHSMLHLLGYDHMEEEDEQRMIAKQKTILGSLGIARE